MLYMYVFSAKVTIEYQSTRAIDGAHHSMDV